MRINQPTRTTTQAKPATTEPTAQNRIGARIRERRLDVSMRQTDLARLVGISASYLNLIEHDRRRIGGKLLSEIARGLNTDVQLLAEGAGNRVLDAMRSAAAGFADVTVELAQLDDMAARYPGWGKLIAAQGAQIKALEARVQGLSDRLSYDPAFASALHGIVSAVTAIRATASILTSDEVIDADWMARFHRNINDDARRLAEQSKALVGYLEQPGDAQVSPLSAAQELEAFLANSDFHLPQLEQGNCQTAPHELLGDIDELRPAAREMLIRFAADYVQAALQLPMADFAAKARDCEYDPLRLAAQTGAPLSVVMRRLASLPPGQGHPPLGLVVCDAGGFIQLVKPAGNLTFPRQDLCPLWPIYTALGQPGRPVAMQVSLAGPMLQQLACHAVAEQVAATSYDLPPMLRATMLIHPDVAENGVAATPLGIACRICPRNACVARREASTLSAVITDPSPQAGVKSVC